MEKIIKQILLLLWQLPQVIVAIFMIPFIGKMKFIDYRNFCWAFECDKMYGSISLGCFVFMCNTHAKRECFIMHELDGHTKDSKIFGPIYLFVIGIPSLFWAWLKNKGTCYYSFYTETRANKHAGLKVNKWCLLIKDNGKE